MKVLVTGADGFVGSWLVPRLLDSGHEVAAAVLPTERQNEDEMRARIPDSASSREFDLIDTDSVFRVVNEGWDAVVHLAAIASGSESRRDPVAAWEVNTLGTVRLVAALCDQLHDGADPLLLFVSTAEVYGAGDPVARVETDPLEPCSVYAASKLAAETAVLEAGRRTGLRVIVARPFPHTGAGQDTRFVVPAFARRIKAAKRAMETSIEVGNLSPVRDFLHVLDVVDAYVVLLESGSPGETYNVASGMGVSVGDLLATVSEAAGHDVTPRVADDLVRPADIPHLVGDSTKLRSSTGWRPELSVRQAVQEVVDAEED